MKKQKATPKRNEKRRNAPARRIYRKPQLRVLGDIRDLTLGVSPGTGDSNDPLNFQP
ncbi:MAG: lasso RiPP family leader peptide-containing protein [Deltaproteobacteria bacterium]|nr:MAG: lasso RiPP family leader peptide-containing protein [Deltaproteobacteria bacterium]